jgi:hypothetical protein
MGLAVYLSEYNAKGQLVGFSLPIYTVLPQITGAYADSPTQVSQIVAGDFTGTGQIQLAVVESQYLRSNTDGNGVPTLPTKEVQAIVYLTPETQAAHAGPTSTTFETGQFYVNPNGVFQPTPYGGDQLPGSLQVSASPIAVPGLTASNKGAAFFGRDEIFYLVGNGQNVHTVDFLGSVLQQDGNTGKLLFSGGQVDENRALSTPTSNNNQPQNITAQAFTVTDLNGDGLADVAILTTDRFVVGVTGNGDASGTQINGGQPGQATGSQDNAGFYLGSNNGGYGGVGALPGGNVYAIVSGDFFNAALPSGYAPNSPDGLMILSDNNLGGTRVDGLQLGTGPQLLAGTGGVFLPKLLVQGNNSSLTLPAVAPVSFDAFYPTATDSTSAIPVAAALDGSDDLINIGPMSKQGLQLTTGSGGDSSIGKGGNGGGIGTGLLTKVTTPQISTNGTATLGAYQGAVNLIYAGDLVFTSGNGGNGFAGGGAAGSVDSVNVVYRNGQDDPGLGVTVYAGNGGVGYAGPGGAGGVVANDSFESAFPAVTAITRANTSDSVTIFAGSGGDGSTGGAGGSVTGNGVTFDSIANDLYVQAGFGGDGPHHGGAGGSISNYMPILPQLINISGSGTIGSLYYVAGDGGKAVSGPGGNGGSVVNSSPESNAYLDNQLFITGGNGGDGLSGGSGGGVSKFTLTLSAQTLSPSQVYVASGFGGDGTAGSGGAGGSVSGVSVPSRGTFGPFNAIFAGDGGDSSGAAGGVGGSIVTVSSSSTAAGYVFAAGAGGSGLTHGGAGGSVLGASVQLGAATQSGSAGAKALVVAGAGGDATAFIADPVDSTPNQSLDAFGGQVGVGGNGGNISGFTQNGSTGAHMDFIAGNGGSTLDYGTIFDTKSYVGKGGSLINVSITGDFGNVAANVPIQSYNHNQALGYDMTVTQYVDDVLRDPATAPVLNDSLGNIGIVVGIGGHIKSVVADTTNLPEVELSQPSTIPLNGSLLNIVGRDLMSAVAGAVDQIAKIQTAQNIEIPGGIVGGTSNAGTNKSGSSTNEYFDALGNLVFAPTLGGSLFDGAVVLGSQPLNGFGQPITLPGAVYVLS